MCRVGQAYTRKEENKQNKVWSGGMYLWMGNARVRVTMLCENEDRDSRDTINLITSIPYYV